MQFSKILLLVPLVSLSSSVAVAQTTGAMEENAGARSAMGEMPMTGDRDKDFATTMKMHEQKSLELAKKELADGKSPQMKSMAQKIVDSQTKEMADLDMWLAEHK